jgi:hypothetical protein
MTAVQHLDRLGERAATIPPNRIRPAGPSSTACRRDAGAVQRQRAGSGRPMRTLPAQPFTRTHGA